MTLLGYALVAGSWAAWGRLRGSLGHFQNEDNLINEEDLKNEDNIKKEDNFKYEDDLKKEEDLRKLRQFQI